MSNMLFSFLYSTEYELVGIYIKNMERIKNVYIHCSYSFGYNLRGRTIDISENQIRIPNYFGPGIIGVTAIIGKNGSNKTTLLEHLANILSKKINHRDEFGVLYYSKRSKSFLYQISHKNLKSIDKSYKFETLEKLRTKMLEISDNHSPNPTPVVMISSQFDNRNYHKNRRNLPVYHDLTTNHLFYKDYENYDAALNVEDPLSKHRLRQVKRQLNALIAFNQNESLFENLNFPKEFTIHVSKIKEDAVTNDLSVNGRSIFRRMREKLRRAFNGEGYNNKLRTKKGALEKGKLWFCVNFLSLYFLLLNEEEDIDNHHLSIELTDSEIDAHKSIELIKYFLNKQNWIPKEEFDLIGCIDEFFDFIDASGILASEDNNSASFSFKIEDGPKIFKWKSKLDRFIKSHYKNKYFPRAPLDFIQLDWRDMSSGEYAYLDLFSKTFEAINEITENKTHRCIPILIDEPDLYLHPELQRKLLHKVFYFFNALHELYKLHFYIIFTTHSPFLVSDMPKECILLLTKADVNRGFKSLAANIYETLNSPFFLENGYIGEHVKVKIESILSDIREKNITPLTYFKHQKLIDAIDDDLLKSQLSQMLRRAYDKN